MLAPVQLFSLTISAPYTTITIIKPVERPLNVLKTMNMGRLMEKEHTTAHDMLMKPPMINVFRLPYLK